jgi:hypothetical protein
MGAAPSTQRRFNPFTGRETVAPRAGAKRQLVKPSYGTQRKCQLKPAYVDPRGFALQAIYGVRDLDMYPTSVYTLDMARQDIRACAMGRDLVHFARVVRYDKIARSDGNPRVYALRKYHGYTYEEIPTALRTLPYSIKDAQVDIATFQRTGRPYYKVVKQTSTVIDPKRQVVRNWRHKGFDNKFKYDVHNPAAKARRLGTLPEMRFDVTKYPLKKLRSGQWGRMVPCAAVPTMCAPGMKEFPYVTGQEKRDVEVGLLRQRNTKRRLKNAQAAHSKKMEQLARRIKALNPSTNKNRINKMQTQRRALRNAFAKAKAGARAINAAK